MTAEIALLNNEAVALAADSAVTLTLPDGSQKILPSANKIFALSKYHPVGVMIYNNTQLVETPWEVIIKEYRRELGADSFSTLAEYANDFLEYLSRSPAFQSELQDRAVLGEAQFLFEMLKDKIDEAAETMRSVPEAPQDPTKLMDAIVGASHKRLSNTQPVDKLPAGFETRMRRRYGAKLRALVAEVLQSIAVSRQTTNRLVDLAIWSITRYPIPMRPTYSGLVIAGFGSREAFASLRSYFVGGLVLDTLVYTDDRPMDLGGYGAAVMPFAQAEMVSAFMEGIDAKFLRSIQSSVSSILQEICEYAEQESGFGPRKRKAFSAVLAKSREKLQQQLAADIDRIKEENFVAPVVRVTAMLPKTELASMAEALVNLTSFQRRVSEEAETVGGPIDVALISKGDGFIWVKRKHYFPAELNPQFFANYNREADHAKDDAGARRGRRRAATPRPTRRAPRAQ